MARRDEAFPVDLAGQAIVGGHPLRWATGAMATAALFLLLTNAEAIDGWAAELAPTPRTARIVEETGRWRAATDRMRLSAPRTALHGMWTRAQAARLPGQAMEEE